LSGGGETFAKGGSDVKAKTGVMRDGGGLVSLRIFESKKPVIGAINGAAVGVGVTMTLPMDIRLASTASKFGFVFAKRGIVPEAASSWFLPRIVGISQATEWCFTGRMISADEAKEGRLVRSVHAPAPVSVALSRQMLWRMLGADHPMQAHRVDSRAINSRGASDDAREGVMSFLEKRPADFPVKVSDGLPEVFPDWQDPQFS
jgi:enoyl-CoA hydratase/carnithine racemase